MVEFIWISHEHILADLRNATLNKKLYGHNLIYYLIVIQIYSSNVQLIKIRFYHSFFRVLVKLYHNHMSSLKDKILNPNSADIEWQVCHRFTHDPTNKYSYLFFLLCRLSNDVSACLLLTTNCIRGLDIYFHLCNR